MDFRASPSTDASSRVVATPLPARACRRRRNPRFSIAVLLLSALAFLAHVQVQLHVAMERGGRDAAAPARPEHGPPVDGADDARRAEARLQTLAGRLYFGAGGDDGAAAAEAAARPREARRADRSLPDGSYRFPAAASANATAASPFAGFRPVLFVTTHMSAAHAWHLDACWPPAMRRSVLLARADVVVYFTSPREQDERWRAVEQLRRRFRHQDLTVHVRDNPGYEEGAMASMREAMVEGWFAQYDWVVRLNPDVILRNDTFLLRTMRRDREAAGVLIDCDARHPREIIHTDFFAVKPAALSPDAFLNVSTGKGMSVERHFAADIRGSILEPGRARWMPGSQPTWHTCRAGFGRRMEGADVFHYHLGKDESRPWAKMPELDVNNLNCPVPF